MTSIRNTSMHVPIECCAALMTQYCHAAARSVLATRQPFNMSHNLPCSFIVIALSYSNPRELGLFTPRRLSPAINVHASTAWCERRSQISTTDFTPGASHERSGSSCSPQQHSISIRSQPAAPAASVRTPQSTAPNSLRHHAPPRLSARSALMELSLIHI